MPILASVRGVDAAGKIVYGLDPREAQGVSVADRGYFAAHRDNPEAGLLISPPVMSRVTRRWSLVLSRRVNQGNGDFAGLVVATIPLDSISERFVSLKLGARGSIGMRDGELRLMVRHPALASQAEIGSTRIADEFAAALRLDRNSGTYHAGESSIDGVQRIHSYRRSDAYPFYVNVGMADDEYLSQWRNELYRSGAMVLLFLLVTIVFARKLQRAWALQQAGAEQFRTVVEHSPLSMALVRIDGTIEYINRKAIETFGYQLQDIPDMERWWAQAYPDAAYRAEATALWMGLVQEALVQQGEIERREYRVTCKNGGVKVMAIFGVWIAGKVLAIFEDVTERKRVEQQLTEALDNAEAANLAKSRFLAAASHDLRQPIQAINLFCSALQASAGLSEEQKQISDYLFLSAKSLGDLLNALLDISKFDAGLVSTHLEVIQAGALFQHVDAEFASLASRKGLRIRVRLPRKDTAILTDARLMHSLLGNLIGNAIKYTERGGILVGIRRRGGKVLIQVWDTGVGIAAEHSSRIFEEYFQIGNPERDRTKGLGLGLAIARRIAKLLRTEVVCRSRPGKGSVFEFHLPLADKAPLDATIRIDSERDGSVPGLGAAGRRIVVLEDDAAVANAIRLSLEMQGMRVVVYESAEAALSDPAIADADFYISDYRLPGANGRQFLDAVQLRSTRPIKAIILTGDNSPQRDELVQSSAWAVLLKPVDLRKLLAVIESQEFKC